MKIIKTNAEELLTHASVNSIENTVEIKSSIYQDILNSRHYVDNSSLRFSQICDKQDIIRYKW